MIIVASTTASWLARSDPRLVLRWLENAEALRSWAGDEVRFFAALEAHPDHREVFTPLLDRIDELDGTVWWFWVDDQLDRAQTHLRSLRVCMGRNLAIEYAMRERPTHVLFLDADLSAPADAIPSLLDVNHPVVGGDVPNYVLSGPVVRRRDDGHEFDYVVQEHWNTAGFLLARVEVLQQVRWGWDPMTGRSDDVFFADQVETAGFGKTWVRKDCIGQHEPLIPLEARGLDTAIDR